VSACICEFLFDFETHGVTAPGNISEKALREIYLKPFQIVCSHPSPDAVPWATMTSYNRVNGLHVSESPKFLEDILRKEWSWKGLTMSDWTGTCSTIEAIRAGLDLEMPGPSVVRGAAVTRAIFAGKLSLSELDALVRNVSDGVRF
jgi:beta-glucosidase